MTQKTIELTSLNQFDFLACLYKPIVVEYSRWRNNIKNVAGYLLHADIVGKNIYISNKKENYGKLLGLMGKFEKGLHGITVIKKRDITKLVTFDSNKEYVIKKR